MDEKNNNIDHDLRLLVSKLLRSGVLTAAAVTIIGGVLFFIQHPDIVFSYDTFNSEPPGLRNALAIIQKAFVLKSRAIIQFGLLILIATPVMRVLLSLVDFFIKKDWIYVVVTSIVLVILFYSLFG